MPDTDPSIRHEAGYVELRRHELRKSRAMMVDGHLTVHSHTTEGGVSARTYRDGYWGFAAESGAGGAAAAERVRAQADRHARAMSRFGVRRQLDLPGGSYRGEHEFKGRTPWSASETVDCLGALHTLCRQRYPDLKSIRVVLGDEHHRKWLSTSRGGESLASIQRAMLYVTFCVEDAGHRPVELTEIFSCKGGLADLEIAPEPVAPVLDRLHAHLQAKRDAVPARGGQCTVVLGPELAGILAHEAMGHPCEADLVLGGAVTGHLVGQPVASERVTMVDFAHRFGGAEAMCPVYVDDEGTPAEDVVLIERGVLRSFMHSRETAARLGGTPTGSARAYGPADEPLIRMRNTAILPGTDKLADMIAGVDDGYLLLKTGNGQADSTTEFMFGISLGYEIRGGRVGRAIRDTTVSGSAIKVLQSVDAVSDDMDWNCSGYCGKKQLMVVAMGGPALRARAHLGGQ